ncbi:MAG: bifunctional 5,10-methylenetetrahydrofolate dehydrogenase/5,10-methenyltetrahydrofolate cyclohydrolase [Candidatus Levybacteria bacterium]|nr:bifunctional 5,10-methylenetetrahydrofolate dehydrogenase/5,10-methenyltetrahydrofolate cyclohydrolase [Candidatus Levybacteria bacterium]
MKIDGKSISQTIYADLTERVGELRRKNITPTLTVILVGNDPGSENYVRQKQIFAEKIGVNLVLKRLESATLDELKPIIDELNQDPLVHGIIIQRPLNTISDEDLDALVIPIKDVDGFQTDSHFDPPVAKAVIKLLESIHPEGFGEWLTRQKITVVGKGRTAGRPTIKHLMKKYDLNPAIIDSKTEDPAKILKNSTIIISAVGKRNAVTTEMIVSNPILIGIGLHTEDDGKLHGDFNESEVGPLTAFYSGTPGGVGPINVAMLLQNVVEAAEQQ